MLLPSKKYIYRVCSLTGKAAYPLEREIRSTPVRIRTDPKLFVSKYFFEGFKIIQEMKKPSSRNHSHFCVRLCPRVAFLVPRSVMVTVLRILALCVVCRRQTTSRMQNRQDIEGEPLIYQTHFHSCALLRYVFGQGVCLLTGFSSRLPMDQFLINDLLTNVRDQGTLASGKLQK